jgi:predicted transposase YdaD
MDFVTDRNPGIKAFIDRIHVGAVPSEVLNKYLQDIKYFNEDIVGIHEEGIQKGKEEGIQIGKEEGIQIGKEEGIQIGKEEGIQIGKEEGIQMIRNVVLSLKQSGMPIDAIARNAGITSAEVDRLISQINSQAGTKVA